MSFSRHLGEDGREALYKAMRRPNDAQPETQIHCFVTSQAPSLLEMISNLQRACPFLDSDAYTKISSQQEQELLRSSITSSSSLIVVKVQDIILAQDRSKSSVEDIITSFGRLLSTQINSAPAETLSLLEALIHLSHLNEVVKQRDAASWLCLLQPLLTREAIPIVERYASKLEAIRTVGDA